MREAHQASHVVHDSVVARFPLLPATEFLQWSDGLEAPSCIDNNALPAALDRDRDRLARRLRELFARREVAEAIFISSPSLHASLTRWVNGTASREDRRAEIAFARYFGRMTSRATPFGMMAGCAVGDVGLRSQLHVSSGVRCHVRLDTVVLERVVSVLNGDPRVRPALRFRPNDSIHRAGAGLQYYERRIVDNLPQYHLVAVDNTPELEGLLLRAKSGASIRELETDLKRQLASDATSDEVRAFIDELIEAQLLVSDLSVHLTGPDPLMGVIDRVAQMPDGGELVDWLMDISRALEDLNAAPAGAPKSAYDSIRDRIRQLPDIEPGDRVFHVDTYRDATVSIGKDLAEEVWRGITLLRAFDNPDIPRLDGFKAAFVERYGDQELPLLDVLDEERGLGFVDRGGLFLDPDSLVESIQFPPGPPLPGSFLLRDRLLAGRILHAARSGRHEIQISEDDFSTIQAHDLKLPDAIGVLTTIGARSPEALAAGDFKVHVVVAGGPPASRMIARFAHGHSGIRAATEVAISKEESLRPNAIHAEIVHWPDGRVANIATRPRLREWEIPYLATGGSPPDRQIPLHDLLVSVRGGRVVLRSHRLNREVLARLNNAHAARDRHLGAYRFLGAVQGQDAPNALLWSWGPFLDQSFLPRVCSGKVILKPARWFLQRRDLESFDTRLSPSERYRRVRSLRDRLQLPRFVLLTTGDNQLLTDLDNTISIDAVAQQVRDAYSAEFLEALFLPHDLCASGSDGSYVNEVHFMFGRDDTLVPRSAPNRSAAPVNTKRVDEIVVKPSVYVRPRAPLGVGTDWLYVKLYSGYRTADEIVAGFLTECAEQFLADGIIDRWFFVRYHDPRPHLRVRFHGDPSRLLREIVPAVAERCRALGARGDIWKWQFDVYDREVDRYGGEETISDFECLFHADSEAAASVVRTMLNQGQLSRRWQMLARSIDRFLDDLEFPLPSRIALMSAMRSSWGARELANKGFRDQLAQLHRRLRRALEAALAPNAGASIMVATDAALARRSAHVGAAVAHIREVEAAGRTSQPLGNLAASCVHMMSNRWLRSDANRQEAVLYDLLLRSYQSMLARRNDDLQPDPGDRPPVLQGTAVLADV